MSVRISNAFQQFRNRKQPTLDVTPQATAIMQRDPLLASSLMQLQDGFNSLASDFRNLDIEVFDRIVVTGEGGKPVAWFGSNPPFGGGWMQECYIGGDDPTNARITADVYGNVLIDGDVLILGTVTARAFDVLIPFPVDLTLADNDPSAGRISWTVCNVYYSGTEYSITAGDTDKQFVYWDSGNSTFTAADSFTPQRGRYLIATNNSGTADEAWNKLGNREVQGDNIELEAIATEHLNATEIKVGGGGGKPGKLGIYNSSDDEIGFFGVYGAKEGGWLKTFGFGGANKENPIIEGDASGNVTIDGATVSFTVGGHTLFLGESGGGIADVMVYDDSVGYYTHMDSSTVELRGKTVDGNPSLGYLSNYDGGNYEAASLMLTNKDGDAEVVLGGKDGDISITCNRADDKAIQLKGDATLSFDDDSSGAGLAGSAGASAGYLIVKHRGTTYKLQALANA